MTKYIFVFALCLSLPAFSNEDGICRDVFQTHGKMKFARQFFTNPDACFLSVNPDYSPDLIYRNFIFRETGKLLVFNSYGPGDQSIMTGARVFYFFPRQQIPAFNIQGSTAHISTSQKNANFFWNTATGLLSGNSQLQIIEDPKIYPENQGGVEIPYFKGLLLDAGFRLGEDPSSELSKKSIFRDEKNETCVVKNSEIFAQDPGGEIKFRLSDAELKKYLNKNCPSLTVDF